MSEKVLNAKTLPKYPPIRENSELLTVAKLLGVGKESWARNAKCRDYSGKSMDILDPTLRPFSFDLIGAVDYVYRTDADNQTARIRIGLELKVSPTRWNDAPETTYEMVMELVRRCNI